MMGRPAIVLGWTFLDNIFYELDSFPKHGAESFAAGHSFAVGGIAITAINLAKLGIATSLATSLGTDIFGNLVETRLAEANVRLTNVPTKDGRMNQSVAMVHGGERAFLTTLGDAARENDLFKHWLDAQASPKLDAWHLHIGLNGTDAWDTIQDAKNQGLTVSVSISHPSIALIKEGQVARQELWNLVDIVFLNETEASQLTGSTGRDILSSLTQEQAISVVTRGEQGAWLGMDPNNWFSCASPNTEVKDTTGAGDSFASGFLAGYLQNKAYPDCLALGVACGSLSTTALGGIDGFPKTMEEAQRVAQTIQVNRLSNSEERST